MGKLTCSKSDWPGFKNSVCVKFATVKFMDINHLEGEPYNLLHSRADNFTSCILAPGLIQLTK